MSDPLVLRLTEDQIKLHLRYSVDKERKKLFDRNRPIVEGVLKKKCRGLFFIQYDVEAADDGGYMFLDFKKESDFRRAQDWVLPVVEEEVKPYIRFRKMWVDYVESGERKSRRFFIF